MRKLTLFFAIVAIGIPSMSFSATTSCVKLSISQFSEGLPDLITIETDRAGVHRIKEIANGAALIAVEGKSSTFLSAPGRTRVELTFPRGFVENVVEVNATERPNAHSSIYRCGSVK